MAQPFVNYGPAVPTNLAAMQPADPSAAAAAAAPAGPSVDDMRAALAAHDAQQTGAAAPPTPAAPAAPAPSSTPSTQDMRDALITHEMNAQGIGSMVPQYQQNQAVARQQAIAAQEAQQEQDDQRITKDTYAAAGGDPHLWAQKAQAAGISMKGLMTINGYNAGLVQNMLKTKELQDDLGAKDFEQQGRDYQTLHDDLAAFAKNTPDYQAANWQNWLSNHADQMTREHMAQTLVAHPGEKAPDPDEMKMYLNMLNTIRVQAADAKDQTAISNAARLQRDDLISSLHAQSTPEGYDAALENASIPVGDIPSSKQMFDSNGNRIENQFDLLDSMALTSGQRSAAQIAKNHLQATANYQKANLAYKGLALQDRNKPQEEKDAVMNVANTFYTANGQDPDAAAAAIKASQDPTVQKYALQAIAQLNASKVSALKPAETQAEIDAKNRSNQKNAPAGGLAEARALNAYLNANPGKTKADFDAQRSGAAQAAQTPAAAVKQRVVHDAKGNAINVELRNNVWVNSATGKPL